MPNLLAIDFNWVRRIWPQRPPMLILFLGLVLAAGAVASLLLATDKLAILERPENSSYKATFLVCVGVAALSLVVAFAAQNIPYFAYKAQQAEEQQTQQAEIERLAARDVLVQQKVQELEQRLRDVEQASISGERVVVFGRSADEVIEGLTTSSLEASVLDRSGRQQAYVVVYLFPDAAFWKYDSYLDFENLNGESLQFVHALRNAPLRNRLTSNQRLIAVGLESSNAHTSAERASQRAAHLCGALFAIAGNANTSVYGLDLGQYVGSRQSRDSLPERRQRTVVVVGVRDIAPGARAASLVPEVLRLVTIPGADMAQYSKAANPSWIQTQECPGPNF